MAAEDCAIARKIGLKIAARSYFFRDRRHVAVDAERFLAGLLHQFTLVPQTGGKILREIDRIGELPFVLALVGAPFDETRPAGQSGEME